MRSRNSVMTNIERSRLGEVRHADALHEAEMERVCARGGIALKDMRRMSMKEKDKFISKHRTRATPRQGYGNQPRAANGGAA